MRGEKWVRGNLSYWLYFSAAVSGPCSDSKRIRYIRMDLKKRETDNKMQVQMDELDLGNPSSSVSYLLQCGVVVLQVQVYS